MILPVPPAPQSDDPEDELATVVALRLMADRLEMKAVSKALQQGWSWARIAQSLGVTRQAAHKRLAHLVSSTDQ